MRARSTARLLLPVFSIALLFGACSGDSAEESGEEARVVDIDGGVCSLLTDAEVAAFVAPYNDGRIGSSEKQPGGNCIWPLADDDEGVGVTVEVDPLSFWAADADTYEENVITGQYGETDTIDDLGDRAYVPTSDTAGGVVNGVNVIKGENVIVVSAFFLDIEPGSPAEDALVDLTRTVVTNLG